MNVSIVMVSHRPDLPWLHYSLRLIQKYWMPKPPIVVRLEEDCRPAVECWMLEDGVEFYYVKPWPDGYTFQMYQKMTADDFTDAELIILWDSDVMLTAPANLDLLLSPWREGHLPIIEYQEWSDAATHSEKVWRGPTSRMMGLDLDREYMCGVPFIYWRETFSKTRYQIARTHRRSFFDCIYSTSPFSAKTFMTHPMKLADFEALGLCAAKVEPDRYNFRHNRDRPKNWPFKLYWSHGGLTDEIKGDLDSLL
jgi:hypothetical protein